MKFPDIILVVDDSSSNRSILINMLKKQLPNVMIHEAGDGQMAADMVDHYISENKKDYDMIIMDFQMPGEMDGAKTTKAVREHEDKHKLDDSKKAFIVSWTTEPDYKHTPYPGANVSMEKNPVKAADVTKALQDYWDYTKILDNTQTNTTPNKSITPTSPLALKRV